MSGCPGLLKCLAQARSFLEVSSFSRALQLALEHQGQDLTRLLLLCFCGGDLDEAWFGSPRKALWKQTLLLPGRHSLGMVPISLLFQLSPLLCEMNAIPLTGFV